MAMSPASDLYVVLVGSTSIPNIVSQGIDEGLVHVILSGSGVAERYGSAVLGKAPVARFTTRAISTALTAVTVNGLLIDASPTMTMWLQLFADGATRLGVTSHYKIIIDDGLLYPVSLRAAHGALAELDFACNICERTGDGTHPISYTAAQSLSGTPEADEQYTLGPCTINAITVTGVQSATIDFGISVAPVAGDGKIYAQGLYVATIQPIIRLQTIDSAMVANLDEDGLAITSSAIVKLRTVAKHTAAAAAAGLSFTATGGYAHRVSYSGAHATPGAWDLVIVPCKYSTNDLVAMSVWS